MSRLSYLNWFARGMVPTFWSHLVEMNRAERYLPSLELAQAWSEHGPAMTMVPLHSRGIRYVQNSLKIRRAHGQRWGEAQSLNFLGMALYTAGRLQEAVIVLEQAAAIFEQATGGKKTWFIINRDWRTISWEIWTRRLNCRNVSIAQGLNWATNRPVGFRFTAGRWHRKARCRLTSCRSS
jgi:hypothetical protein